MLAIVEGIPITQLEWDRLAEPYFQEVEARAGRKLTDEEKSLLRKNVLQELVRERLWVADAKRRGFTATQADVDARLQRNEYFKTNGKYDPQKFREFKFSPSSNYSEIVSQVGNAVLLDKYVAWMKTRYAVPDAELRKEFVNRTAQASIRYLWLTPDQISLEPQAGAEQIRAYYEGHPDLFRSPEEARLSYIRVPIEYPASTSDTLRRTAEAQALLTARALLASLKSGKSAEAVSKDFGGMKDTGRFAVGEPIRGLGRSDALADAVRAGRLKQWLSEPVRVGNYFVLCKLDEHRESAMRPFREAAGLAKRRADAEIRDAVIDSLARIDYASSPDRYRVPLLRAAVVARATDSFVDSRPVSEKEVARTLERIRKGAGLPDTARVWADSILKTLPDLVRKERQLDQAFRTMGEAAERLKRGDSPDAVARRFSATLDPISIYRGQPPEQPILLEGAFLDSLFNRSPGTVLGPRVLHDSVFVVRVAEANDKFQPPYEAVRPMAHAEAERKRQAETEREAQSWFELNRDKYRTPERWTFDYVLFRRMKPDSAPVPEDSIRAYYDQHSLEFTIPGRARVREILIGARPGDGPGARGAARTKAVDILRRVKAGENFESLAREFSDDRSSAARGGDLGEITRGQVPKEYGDAVFALKPGEIGPLIDTQFGFHIVRLDSLTPQRLRSLDESREEIRTVLGESVVDSLARGQAETFAERAAKPGARFEDLAKAHGGASSAGPLGRQEPVQGLGVIPGMESEIGSLHEGGVSRPIAMENGYLVARLVRSFPPRPAAFGEVKEEAIRGSQNERRRALVASINSALQRELRAGKDLETLALPLGGLRLSRTFPRNGPIPDLARDSILARDSTFYREIFASRPGTTLKPRAGALGTVYAEVDSVSTLSPKDYAEHRAALKAEIFEQRAAAWTDRLRARAKIQLLRKDLKL
ncbi:MAG TPA: peptidyl-prolyl cis-trans isomerase [Candidatus Limnocylindrales bacterium]|nr:peptidyl-prolyl cis-trans isomerase [Candidatus Limnocylindrales bacterium]